jgi:hypothetical protein
MTVLPVKRFVSIITDFHQAVFDPKSIGEIFIQLMFGNFDNPVVQILPIEKLYPRGRIFIYISRSTGN